MDVVDSRPIEILALDIVSYEAFIRDEEETRDVLKRALKSSGIVGIRGIPGYEEKVRSLIERAREFSSLPDEVKDVYAPDYALGGPFLGYQKGREKFKGLDGQWVEDNLKVSYFGFVPDNALNKWPDEVDLRTPFQELGRIMSEVGEALMTKMGLLGTATGISLEGVPRLGRMLYYGQNQRTKNPFWCGAHCDHGLFTALLPAFYFSHGVAVPEPAEAGLFVRTPSDGLYKKVCANDPDVLLFQVGEFAQLATDDGQMATKHRVNKAAGDIERYTMALFFDASLDAVVRSHSELARDRRYGGGPGTPCSYLHWQTETYNQFLVKDGIDD